MLNKYIIFIFLICTSCASMNNNSNINNTSPYNFYCYFSFTKTEEDFCKHWINPAIIYPKDKKNHAAVARYAYSIKHLGLALFAANEWFKLDPSASDSNFAIGIILGVVGLKSSAQAKLNYVVNKNENVFLVRRATRALIELDETGVLKREKNSI